MSRDTRLDWQLKFRRVLVLRVGEERPHDWEELLKEYANDVTIVNIDNYYARDYLRLPADCMVVDCRIPDHDITGVGVMLAAAEQETFPPVPVLVFHDDRPYWEVDYLAVMYRRAQAVRYDPSTALDELRKFLEATPTKRHTVGRATIYS